MSRQQNIRNFVKHILGCTCPDKVFEQIEDRQVEPSSSPHVRSITIGGRLLIYIWYVESPKNFEKHFLAMLDAGKKERDERGLNRFRAVLAVDDTLQQLEAKAISSFSQCAASDEHIHFHIVSPADLKDV